MKSEKSRSIWYTRWVPSWHQKEKQLFRSNHHGFIISASIEDVLKFIDYQKAFNTVDRVLLWKELWVPSWQQKEKQLFRSNHHGFIISASIEDVLKFIDYQKAFNTVDRVLLWKELYSVDIESLFWLSSKSSSRKRNANSNKQGTIRTLFVWGRGKTRQCFTTFALC